MKVYFKNDINIKTSYKLILVVIKPGEKHLTSWCSLYLVRYVFF